MSNAKRIVAWRDVAKPHSDIIEGRFDPSVFAVNIFAVYRNKAPSDYQEPERFFAKTYLTRGLKELISSVLRRLDGQPSAEPVTDLVTSFGGGKTHALLCLYHLAREGKIAVGWQGVSELLNEANVTIIPKARVAVLSGEDIDVVQGVKGEKGETDRHTMWGELAWQLGGESGYALVKKSDEIRSSPSAETLTKVLALNPSNLILIDEALRYVSRGRAVEVHETSLASQALNFFEALTVAVAQTPKTALVVTLPSSLLEMAREDEQDYKRLVHLFQRLERTRRLAEGDEIYEIVRRRLFEDLGDPEEHARTANAYFDYYREHRDSFTETVTTPAYLQKLKRAYPFHPEFLDVLNERWSSITQFQRTRGMLRMLALLIGERYKTDSTPLIQISSAQFSIRDFRSEVLQQLDARRFDPVIESDVSGTGARAAKIDEQGNPTYQREHIAEGVATAIFFYSFGGVVGGQPAASLPNIRLAVLRPGLEPAFIADAIELLRKPISGLFYLEVEGERYRFGTDPNLNMLLAEREAAVNNDEVEKLLTESIQKQIGNRFRTIAFPEEPRDVADQAQLTLVIISPDETIGKNTKEATKEKILSIMKGGATYRTNRNCLIFVAADEHHAMRQNARTVIALRDIERLYARANKLSATQKSQLEGIMEDADKALSQSIWQAYRYAITPASEDNLDVDDMGRQIQRADRKISDTIWDHLVNRERLAPKIGPSRLLSKDLPVWKDSESSISTKELRDGFLSYTYLPMIPSIDVLRDTIVQGIQNGDFAYAQGSKEKFQMIKIGTSLERDSIEFADDAFLLRSEEAYNLLGTVPTTRPGVAIPTPSVGPGTAVAPRPLIGTERYDAVNVSADLDWKKWSEFHEAVIQPLVNAGAELKVKVEVMGSSEEGISPNTVDFAIKEGLTQYGIPAKVEPKKKEP